jgi:plasmid stability protein
VANITIHNLDAHVVARLRVRAAHRQRSMEEEARNILRVALAQDDAAPREPPVAGRSATRPIRKAASK